MTDKEFANAIEGTINDVAEGLTDRETAIKSLMDLFLKTATPAAKSKEHLEIFIYRVSNMRELQREFFLTSKKAVLAGAKKHEAIVDNAIKKLTTEYEYDIEKLKRKYDQKKMF